MKRHNLQQHQTECRTSHILDRILGIEQGDNEEQYINIFKERTTDRWKKLSTNLKTLMKTTQTKTKWTEFCNERLQPDTSLLQNDPRLYADDK
ncbi:hypothetical protein DPMN_160692, partial [Dreissena polymorpha]